MIRKLIIFFCVIGVMQSIGEGSIFSQEKDALSLGPAYEPTSKSYFEVRKFKAGYNMWEHARKDAERQVFKGTRGRLAVIDNMATHEFLGKTFKLKNEAWIGLRYWCSSHKSQWINREFLNKNSFSAWHPQWVRDPTITCFTQNDLGYMPVFYTPGQNMFLWQTTGPKKGFDYYIAQYPTGGP